MENASFQRVEELSKVWVTAGSLPKGQILTLASGSTVRIGAVLRGSSTHETIYFHQLGFLLYGIR